MAVTEKMHRAFVIGKKFNVDIPATLNPEVKKGLTRKARTAKRIRDIEDRVDRHNRQDKAAKHCEHFARTVGCPTYASWHDCFCLKEHPTQYTKETGRLKSCTLVWRGRCEHDLCEASPSYRHKFLHERVWGWLKSISQRRV